MKSLDPADDIFVKDETNWVYIHTKHFPEPKGGLFVELVVEVRKKHPHATNGVFTSYDLQKEDMSKVVSFFNRFYEIFGADEIGNTELKQVNKKKTPR